MFLLAGLGNPGAKYASSRHNVGFMAIDAIAEKNKFPLFRQRFGGLVCRGRIEPEDVILFKPNGYMNNSGQPLAAVVQFFKLSLPNIWVIHDDLDIEPGRVRVKTGGSAGGHNGLKSIDSHIGRGYSRLRIGIGRPPRDTDVSNYVLSNFKSNDLPWLDNLISEIAGTMPFLLNRDSQTFCNNIVSSMRSISPGLKPDQ
ncbi:MAG: aminoacyl-tRNA hydrolase [Rhodospirillaceae bacterium]|nr:aminoacyl-tRNA hydrolase [Rhodospirillaceae bacterium]|tara:strand:+ start:104 stop:700 length:597 start_codon:yes stop_codon:yes gene_type:complete